MRPKTLNLTAQSVFEKLVKEEKIHDLNLANDDDIDLQSRSLKA